MPIMYEPDVKKAHKCKPPSSWHNDFEKAWESRKPTGTLWKCRKCGAYYVTINKSIVGKHWYRVKENGQYWAKVQEIESGLGVDKKKDVGVSSGIDKFFRDIGRALTFKKG